MTSSLLLFLLPHPRREVQDYIPPQFYHLQKAQSWLDMVMHHLQQAQALSAHQARAQFLGKMLAFKEVALIDPGHGTGKVLPT